MDNKDFEKIKKIKEREALNYKVVEILASYLNKCPRLITEDTVKEITGGDKNCDETAVRAFLASAFIEDEKLERLIENEYFKKGIRKLDPEKYENDPYFKNIKINPKRVGNCSLGYETYEPYECFVCNESICVGDFTEIPQIGFFDNRFSFPAVFENGVEWMAIKPNEIETMREHIEKAHGKVVAFGLGLGYFAYMASEKESVSGVTIIEQNENVISLFENNILPKFSHPEKIRIIKYDAFEYVKEKMGEEVYDFAFVDLWHDVSDGTEMYIKMKKSEHFAPKTEFSYWIERSILLFIRWKLFDKLLEGVDLEKGDTVSTENEKFKSLTLAQIENVLSPDYLKNFVKFI